MSKPDDKWTEGVCGDGAAILYDGMRVDIASVIERLNSIETLRKSRNDWVRSCSKYIAEIETLTRECDDLRNKIHAIGGSWIA